MVTKWYCKRKAVVAGVLSLLFGIMQVAGYQMSMHFGTSVHQSDFFQNIGVLSVAQCVWAVIVAFVCWSVIIYLLFTWLEQRKECKWEVSGKINLWIWVGATVVLFVCWLPYFFAAYPGFYNYDAMVQVPQALYEEVLYSAHHPLLHTLFMGKIIKLGLSFGGTLNSGIVLHSLVQMLLCAMAFGYLIYYVGRASGRKGLGIAALVYYGLFPVIPMFALSTTKDTLFSVILQLTVVFLYEMCKDVEAFWASKWRVLRFVATVVLMCLLRKNGIYALACMVPFVISYGKKYWKKFLLLFGVTISLYLGIDGGLMWALNAVPGSAEEMLCVPMQQLAKVYNEHGEEAFSEEELELIYAGISKKQLLNYNPFLADHIKNYFDYNVIAENKGEFLNLWIEKGLEYPWSYIKAFLYNTYQAWYPNTFVFPFPGSTETYFFDMNMQAGAVRDTKNQGLLVFCQQIGTEPKYQRIPILRMLFSMGAMLWVAMFAFAYGIYRKNRPLVLALGLVLLYCATVFLGPVSLVRYYLVLFYGLPVNVAYLVGKEAHKV